MEYLLGMAACQFITVRLLWSFQQRWNGKTLMRRVSTGDGNLRHSRKKYFVIFPITNSIDTSYKERYLQDCRYSI
jgi:hypothetical protein